VVCSMAQSPDFEKINESAVHHIKPVHPRGGVRLWKGFGVAVALVIACTPQVVETPIVPTDGGFITPKPVATTPAPTPYKDLTSLPSSRVPSLELIGAECVSDGVSQLIYQTVEGNLARQSSDLTVNIGCDGYPRRSLSGLNLDCNGVTVADARAVTQTYRGSLFIVDSGGQIRLTALVTPSNSPIAWKTAPFSSNLPNGGTFAYPIPGNYSTVEYQAPINSGNQAEGATIRGDLSQNPWTFCPNVELAVLPLSQP